jgi:virginiamycin B lyase
MSSARMLLALGLLGWIVPVSAQTFTEFPLPTRPSGPLSIVSGPDGALWFTEYHANAIGRCTLSGEITEFPLPLPARGPWDIAVGADGNIWFTESASGSAGIGRITLDGDLEEFPLPDPDAFPRHIVSGPDGALWFTETRNRLGRITTVGEISELEIASPYLGLFALTIGPDGNLWFGVAGRGLVSITPLGEVVDHDGPAGRDYMITGPDGSLWGTSFGTPSGTVSRLSASGEASYYSIRTPLGITVGPDGNIWITEAGYRDPRPPPFGLPPVPGGIGRFTNSGQFTDFHLRDPNLQPTGIVTGWDGNIWFTQFAGSSIVRLSHIPRPPRLTKQVAFR